MKQSEKHRHNPDTSFDGGDLDCGNGLLLLIRKNIDPLRPGQLLEILSTDSTVEEELPAWCRLTKNELVSFVRTGDRRSYLVSKGPFEPQSASRSKKNTSGRVAIESRLNPVKDIFIPESLPDPGDAPEPVKLSVMGVGSFPRPAWMMRALAEYLEGRLSEEEFNDTADDAVKLCVSSQLDAGVDVVSEGEQRRDNYASFVGNILDNCQLVPLTDLLPLVEDPDKFKKELDSLDVPASKVRHPIVYGPLGRSKPLLDRDLALVSSMVDKPVKLALPGPYLLTRMMWMDCIVNDVYDSREALAGDIVRVLNEEIHHLLAGGASIVQLDEPVLTEVVHAGAKNKRSFMCGALSETDSKEHELSFAVDLINRTVEKLPAQRLGLHICRGNWTKDESIALVGSYEPLMDVLKSVNVGNLFLEYCTDRAGDIELIKEIPINKKIGVGVVNPKSSEIETPEAIFEKASIAARLIGEDRLYLVSDCGFATFADNPVSSMEVALKKLKNMARARKMFD